MRKVNVKLEVKLVIVADEGVSIYDLLDEIEYSFKLSDECSSAEIIDESIEDYEISDSR